MNLEEARELIYQSSHKGERIQASDDIVINADEDWEYDEDDEWEEGEGLGRREGSDYKSYESFLFQRKSVCEIGILFDDGVLEIPTFLDCHASVHDCNRKSGAEAIISVFQDKYSNYSNLENSRRWMDWILNTSPYSRSFVTKDVDEAMEYNFVSKTNLDRNLVVGALAAARMCNETPIIAETWANLVDRGFDKDVAYVLAHNYNAEMGSDTLHAADHNWHVGFIGNASEVQVKNFLNNKHVKNDSTFKEHTGYSYFTRYWGENKKGYGNRGNFTRQACVTTQLALKDGEAVAKKEYKNAFIGRGMMEQRDGDPVSISNLRSQRKQLRERLVA